MSESAVNTRANKDNWKALLTKVSQRTSDAVDRQLKQAELKWKSAVALRFEYLAGSLPAKPLTHAKELSLMRDMEPAMRNARTVFAWGEARQGTPMVRIGLLGTATLDQTQPPLSLPPPPIDVVSEKNLVQPEISKSEGEVDALEVSTEETPKIEGT